jgi:thimet oligopeptidase
MVSARTLLVAAIVMASMATVGYVLFFKKKSAVDDYNKEFGTMMLGEFKTLDDGLKIFPRTALAVNTFTNNIIAQTKQSIAEFLSVAPEQRTFENTIKHYDELCGTFGKVGSGIHVLEMVSPDDAVREAAHENSLKLQQFAVDAFSNKEIYQAFKAYLDGQGKTDVLDAEYQYYISESMREFKKAGFDLPDAEFEIVKNINKELSALGMNFDSNIAKDSSKVAVERDGLAGLGDDFINALQKDADGHYVLGCDYPTYTEVMEHCSIEETRQKLYRAFNNRAYPVNKQVLSDLIAKRDELARQLGYASYAALNIDGEMVKTPERAEAFIRDLAARAQKKAAQEIEMFKADMPAGVTLTADGLFKPWDFNYVKAQYKKKHLTIDDRLVAEYFELDPTLKGIFDIYQRFLNLRFKLVKPSWAWHEDVQAIEIYDKDTDALRGYVLLDLHPRANKYSHACCASLIQTVQRPNANGVLTKTPSLCIVIANFSKPTTDKPSLLQYREVETFFHEFGHAMHNVLASTKMIATSGTAVKTDFVEMPSQIFEEWMADRDLLKGLGKHYKTGQALPDQLIDKLLQLKKFESGNFLIRQCALAMISLWLFNPGTGKDIDSICHRAFAEFVPYVTQDDAAHFQYSFGHLNGYGARYYGYMWALVYALDIFAQIKPQGLVNPAAGKVFIDKILGKGGSVDPNELLRDYLGREPQQDAFFKDLGLD